MKIIKSFLIFFVAFAVISCNVSKKISETSNVVYQTKDLIITQTSNNTFEHTSFLQTEDFGLVPCNGLIVRDKNEVIIFDTPENDKSSAELIHWINKKLHCKINAIIPTHFHADCLGGLNAFHQHNIPSYAYYKTIEFAKENKVAIPEFSFKDSLVLKVGNQEVIAKFFGEGHTKDNIVGYFPSEDIMFGGCLIKELNATKGYLGDANVNDWSKTVEKVKSAYPNVKTIIPGHGKPGDQKLLDYTIKLFK